MTTLVGAVLMITAGALAVSYHSDRYSQRNYYKDAEVRRRLHGPDKIALTLFRPVSPSGSSPSSPELSSL